MLGLVEGRGKEKEERGGEWDLGGWFESLAVFSGRDGNSDHCCCNEPLFNPIIFSTLDSNCCLCHIISEPCFLGLWGHTTHQPWCRVPPGPRLSLYWATATETQTQPQVWNNQEFRNQGIVDHVFWGGQLDWQPWLVLFAGWMGHDNELAFGS